MGTLTKTMTEEILQKYEIVDYPASLPAPSIGKSPQPDFDDEDDEDHEGSDAEVGSSDDDDDDSSKKETPARKTKKPKRRRDSTPSPKTMKKQKTKKDDEVEEAMEVGYSKPKPKPKPFPKPKPKPYPYTNCNLCKSLIGCRQHRPLLGQSLVATIQDGHDHRQVERVEVQEGGWTCSNDSMVALRAMCVDKLLELVIPNL